MEVPEGLSWVGIMNISFTPRIQYMSDSVTELLGWEPKDMLNKQIVNYIHPDEVVAARSLIMDALLRDRAACICYLRMRKTNGEYVLIYSAYNVVYDRIVCTGGLAVPGQKTRLRSLSAVEVFSLSPLPPGQYDAQKWQDDGAAPGPPTVTPMTSLDDPPPMPPLEVRTCIVVNRFTEASTIIYSTNNIFINHETAYDHSIYDYIVEEDVPGVEQKINDAKGWGRKGDSKSEGGFEYGTFRLYRNGRPGTNRSTSGSRSTSVTTDSDDVPSATAVASTTTGRPPFADDEEPREVDAFYNACSDALLVFLRWSKKPRHTAQRT